MPRIVELKDQTPLLIKPEDTANGIVAVCRCGLSGNWPYCNGTHKATVGEDPEKVYHYDRQLPQGTPQRHEVDAGTFQHWRTPADAPKPHAEAQRGERHERGHRPAPEQADRGRPERNEPHAQAAQKARIGQADPGSGEAGDPEAPLL